MYVDILVILFKFVKLLVFILFFSVELYFILLFLYISFEFVVGRLFNVIVVKKNVL